MAKKLDVAIHTNSFYSNLLKKEKKMVEQSTNFSYTRILRLAEVRKLTGLSKSTIYKWMQERIFPQQIKLGARSVGWLASDVDAFITSRIETSKTHIMEEVCR